MKKTQPIPSSANIAAEAYKALGLRGRLPAALQKRLSGTRPMPTEATADRRAKPQAVRQRLAGNLLYALLPPEALQDLMGLPDVQSAWSRWTGIADLTARRGQEWDNVLDALLHGSYEHPLLKGMRRLAELMQAPTSPEHEWLSDAVANSTGRPTPTAEERRLHAFAMEQRAGAVRELLTRISQRAADQPFVERLKALLVRFVVREIALREAAASLVWDLGTFQDVGPTWHLLPPVEWLERLLGRGVTDIPKTTRQRWTAITNNTNINLHWKSIDQLVLAISKETNADAAGTALLRIRIGSHLILRRLGVAVQQKFPKEHQQLSLAYTNQVRQFRSILEQAKDGISSGTTGNPRPDLMELALFGPMPMTHGAWMVDHVFQHHPEDRIEAATMQNPFWCVLLTARMVPDDLELRHILAGSGRARHQLGVTSLLPKKTLSALGPLFLQGGPL